ncbi:MAG: discoidin domain-containing protein [Alphaproteobacteria bacterium]|nr:discoidin domain-containing protein [Alphaproteobacteria bacterium]
MTQFVQKDSILISKKNSESGRTMLEVLAVIALIALLSIGTIAMYQRIMNSQKAESLYNDFRLRALLTAEQKDRGNNIFTTAFKEKSTYNLPMTVLQDLPSSGYFLIQAHNVKPTVCNMLLKKGWLSDSVNQSLIPARFYIDNTPYEPNALPSTCPNRDITFKVAYRSKKADQEDRLGNICTSDSDCDTGCSTCYKESGETRGVCTGRCCALNESLSSGCTCPAHRDTTGGQCGGCVAEQVWVPWTQPVLAGYGTMGGNSTLATRASSEQDTNRRAWKAFDGLNRNEGTDCWHSSNFSPSWLAWYTKNPIKISSITITNRYCTTGDQNLSYTVKDFTIQYSDNGSNWQDVLSATNQKGHLKSSTFNIIYDAAHQYWRLYITSNYHSTNKYVSIGELTIEAVEQQTVEYTFNSSTRLCE